MADWLSRLILRIGYRAARLWWFLVRPDHHGAVIAVWHEGRILAVRQSYRDGLTWPGGGIHRGEHEAQAAQRELAEELGITVDLASLHLVQRVTTVLDHRLDHIRIFELYLAEAPVVRIDRREIIQAKFMTPGALLAHRVPSFVRNYLDERVQSGG